MAINEAIKFYNPTDENYVGTWDGESYDIPAKSTKYFAIHIAEHFAKHLVNKILLNQFDELCKKHSKSDKDLLKTCKNCKLRSDKLGSFYEAPERKELLEQILPKDVPQEPKAAE